MSSSGTSDQNAGWNNAPWESSLSHGSLNEPSATSGTGATPNPFSRQGSDPADELGADPEAVPPAATGSWPTYPGQDAAPGAAASNPAAPQAASYPAAPSEAYGGYTGSNPYGQPPAPNFDPQPTQPYAGGYATPAPAAPPAEPTAAASAYGSNPYEANPYATNPYEVSPYQASYGGYGAYGIVPTMHPQSVPALVTGILGLAICPLVGIVGLVLGNKARKAIDAEPGRYTGRGQATAGFVLGIISIVLTVLYVIFIAAGMSGALDYN